jgi:hypothetical protein
MAGRFLQVEEHLNGFIAAMEGLFQRHKAISGHQGTELHIM